MHDKLFTSRHPILVKMMQALHDALGGHEMAMADAEKHREHLRTKHMSSPGSHFTGESSYDGLGQRKPFSYAARRLLLWSIGWTEMVLMQWGNRMGRHAGLALIVA